MTLGCAASCRPSSLSALQTFHQCLLCLLCLQGSWMTRYGPFIARYGGGLGEPLTAAQVGQQQLAGCSH